MRMRSQATLCDTMAVAETVLVAEKSWVPPGHSLSLQSICIAPTSANELVKSPSQKSISTDEGSSSSGCSSSPIASDSSPCSIQQSGRTLGVRQSPRDLPERIFNPRAPIWVDNGLTGDEAAWLLVMPKFPELAHGSVMFPKSPKDAVLLGPYVTTKNTFLDEERIGEAMEFRQKPRAKSVGAFR